MFCLWLPLLFIPTNASPAFIFLFFVCTYFLHRPCVYCSILLIILFLTSCNWSDRCFFDYNSNWFLPRPGNPLEEAASSSCSGLDCPVALNSSSAAVYNGAVLRLLNSTVTTLSSVAATKPEWTGLGLGWLRNLLGQREWQIECMDIYIRL
ncbi:Bladder cancer-related BC10-like protein [Cordyceps javanica]|nr:Bladder cancer-related BC10-like protein [Cordyceps javanica]